MPDTSEAAQAVATATTVRFTTLVRSIFSFPVMCMFLLSAVIFGFCVRQFAEPDIWWHLRNAQYLAQHHSFPNVDYLSFTAAGAPRPNYEWLSEVPFLVGFHVAGLQGILVLYFLVLVLIYAGVYYRTCRAGADCKDAVPAALMAVSLGVISIGPRVLLFGWLCMVGLLLVLDQFHRTGRGLWLLPPLFCIWVNLHPSWIFGIAVLLITIVCGLFEGEWGVVMASRWTREQQRKLLTASAATAGALFVNPFGYKLVTYPFEFLFRQQANINSIEEWQSVDFSNGTGKLVLVLIFALLTAVFFSRRRWRLVDVVLTAFALWAGLSHVRLLFFTGLIIPSLLGQDLKLFTLYEAELDKPWLNATVMAVVVSSMVLLFPSTAKLQQQIDDSYPTAALRFMQERSITGRIFNQYAWGGYMEWTTPVLKPFIDGRADVFIYNGVFDDYFRAVLVRQPFEILDKYQVDYALLDPERPLAYLLAKSPSWEMIHRDNVAVLFERVTAKK